MRLTLDIDGREWWAWAVYYHLRDSGEFDRVEIWRTRRGYHIIAYGGGFTEMEINVIRATLGDDKLRLIIDEAKIPLQPRQVLWSVKNGWEVEKIG
ncbi:MAG: hypothetical protein RMI45_08405 [Ignisphaera sp.]|nr:hypothetical protein [Ignisphaera sp.]